MSRFLTELDTRRLPGGRYKLLAPLVYESDVLGMTLTVPAGFEYDGMSIPWFMPIANEALREPGARAAAVHDWLYSNPHHAPRDKADAALREALEVDGVNWLLRNYAWLGVRIGGGSHFDQGKGANDVEGAAAGRGE